jgi:hypothetical protein
MAWDREAKTAQSFEEDTVAFQIFFVLFALDYADFRGKQLKGDGSTMFVLSEFNLRILVCLDRQSGNIKSRYLWFQSPEKESRSLLVLSRICNVLQHLRPGGNLAKRCIRLASLRRAFP